LRGAIHDHGCDLGQPRQPLLARVESRIRLERSLEAGRFELFSALLITGLDTVNTSEDNGAILGRMIGGLIAERTHLRVLKVVSTASLAHW
jgi:hypothetical protein